MSDTKTGVKRVPDVDVEIKGTTIHGQQTKGVKIVEQGKPLEKKIEVEKDA